MISSLCRGRLVAVGTAYPYTASTRGSPVPVSSAGRTKVPRSNRLTSSTLIATRYGPTTALSRGFRRRPKPTVRAGSVTAAVQRLDRAVAAIARLGTFMEMRVSADDHDLRVREIELTGDFLIKVQEEREAERAAREELREQRKAAAELQAEHDRLEKEREHYQNALNAIQAQGGDAQQVLERLGQIDEL